jgi:hypothetical protein
MNPANRRNRSLPPHRATDNARSAPIAVGEQVTGGDEQAEADAAAREHRGTLDLAGAQDSATSAPEVADKHRRTLGAPALRPVQRKRRLADLRRDHPQPHPRRRTPRRRRLRQRQTRHNPDPDHQRHRPHRSPGPNHPPAPPRAPALASGVRQPLHRRQHHTRLNQPHPLKPGGPTTGHNPEFHPEQSHPEEADHTIGDSRTPSGSPNTEMINGDRHRLRRWIKA